MYKVYPHSIFYGWQEYPGIEDEASAIEVARGFVENSWEYDEAMVVKKSKKEGDTVIGVYRNEREGIYKQLTKGVKQDATKNKRK